MKHLKKNLEQMHETQSPSEPDQVVPWDRNKQIENTVKTESDGNLISFSITLSLKTCFVDLK